MGITDFEKGNLNQSEIRVHNPVGYKIPDNTRVDDFENIDTPCEKKSGNFRSKGLLLVMVLICIGAAAYHFWAGKTDVHAATVNMSLAGILYSDHNPAALVEQKIVHEGEMIKGVKVVKIYPDKVEFEKNGQKWCQPAEGAKTASARPAER